MNMRLVLFAFGVLVAALVGTYLYLDGSGSVTTDNAYLKFDKVTLSSELAGRIAAIHVVENTKVAKGDLLVTLDDAAYVVQLRKAEARLKKAQSYIRSLSANYRTKYAQLTLAESNLDFAKKEYERELNLSRKNLTSEALIDDRRHNLDVAREHRTIVEQELAQILANLNGRNDAPIGEYPEVMEAQADLDLARIDLDHARIVAPFDGFVSHLAKLGQYTNPGSPILSLVSDTAVWVEANFKETDLVNLRVGQVVDVTVDAYPDLHWKGTVESLNAATGAEYSLLPPQNATGNWIKVVQRVPIRIRLEPNQMDPVLRAGMSAYIKIDLSSAGRHPDGP